MTTTPNGATPTCQWCDGVVSPTDTKCPTCFLLIEPVIKANTAHPEQQVAPTPTSGNENSAKKAVTRASKKATSKKATGTVIPTPQQVNAQTKNIEVCLGIDPGARYTAVSLRDEKGTVYLSATYYRDDDTDEIEWMHVCVQAIEEILEQYEADIIAVEKTVDPKGFGTQGKRDPLNPKDIVRTAIVVGGIAQRWKHAIPIRPRRNGSAPLEEYPESIQGRRPADLPGHVDPRVKTRKHERSAYDVAGHAFFENRKKNNSQG